MNNPKQLHIEATKSYNQAKKALAEDRMSVFRDYLLKAFESEKKAANLLFTKLDAEPTRSILFRGAASLAIQCRKFSEARRLIHSGLSGFPPSDIESELNLLLDHSLNNFEGRMPLSSENMNLPPADEIREVGHTSTTLDTTSKLLIVDDNAINRVYFKSVFSKEGFEVLEASSGLEALEKLSFHVFDLILLDVQMPHMDGFETLAEIKMNHPNVKCPILAISSFYERESKDSFIDAGFNDFIEKPIRPNQLKGIVKSWLKGYSFSKNLKNEKLGGIIDKRVYKEIRQHLPNKDLAFLYTEFEKETQESFDKLRILISLKNYPEILSILHNVKNNSGSLGIYELQLSLEKLERDILSNKEMSLEVVELVDENFSKFQKEYKKVLNLK